MKDSNSAFELLANEIIQMILLYLPLNDLKNISTLNKRFHFLLQNPILITIWLRHQKALPLIKMTFPDGAEMPFSPFWLLRSAILGKEITYKLSVDDGLSKILRSVDVTLSHQSKEFLLNDYCRAAHFFWKQLTQAEITLLAIYDHNPNAWPARLSFANAETLFLALLHQFPYWEIQDRHTQEMNILERQAFIASLIEIGFLPDYGKKEVREKLANKDLILFPFSPEQDGADWRHAMQWLYQQEGLAELRLVLSEIITNHCQLLLKQEEHWASAYLAVKFMTVYMSQPHEFSYAIDYLTITINWLTALLPSYLFADYGSGVGQLVYEMLIGFNNSKQFQPKIFRDFRSAPWERVNSPIVAANRVFSFIALNQSPEHDLTSVPNMDLLKKTMEKGQTLFKALRPYIKRELEKEEESECLSSIELF